MRSVHGGCTNTISEYRNVSKFSHRLMFIHGLECEHGWIETDVRRSVEQLLPVAARERCIPRTC